jgi:hypothetical protein
MPYDDPDPADPMLLVGVTLPAGENSAEDMAYVFAEEFARLGFSEQRLLSLFHEPFYAGAHQALELLGEERIRLIVQEAVGMWGQVQYSVQEPVGRSSWDVSVAALRFPGSFRINGPDGDEVKS